MPASTGTSFFEMLTSFFLMLYKGIYKNTNQKKE
jgi:hypothetical protein